MTETQKTSHSDFHSLGIAPEILALLDRLGFVEPTPIQHASIPAGVAGQDVIGIAQTGTGKTLAFAIPMVQRLQGGGCGLVIVPTRELALQVAEVLEKVGAPFGLRTVVLIGGAAIGPQTSALRARPALIVATPGRLIDHLQSGTARLDGVKILVLDEADRMLDMGFAPQIKKVMQYVRGPHQTMLYSATMPAEIVEIAKAYMQLPVRVEVARPGTAPERVTHELYVVKREAKRALLGKLLDEYPGTVLVFSRTKHGARKILRDVQMMGHTGAEIHSNRSLSQRREALDGFKSGKYRVLVATDIAARGIDVTGIEVVMNYDLPDQADDYVHRIGRTGRAGRAGHAISFATPEQGKEVQSIEKLIRTELSVSEASEHSLDVRPAPFAAAAAAVARPQPRRQPPSGPPRRTGGQGRAGGQGRR